jgi:hypothetical protein
MGIPAFCFSPMANTPSLLHDHNEVCWKFNSGLNLWSSIHFLLYWLANKF